MRRAVVLLPILLAVYGCGGGEPSATQPAAEVDEATARAVEVRQSVLRLLSHNYRPMRDMARGNADYDAEVIALRSARVVMLADMLPEVFAPDTRGANVETEARDRIWEEPEAFAAKHQALRDAAAALVAASGSADQETVLAAVSDLGGRCGSCHDDFRLDD